MESMSKGKCLNCEYLKIESDWRGCEAKCIAKTKKGRIITWYYGMGGFTDSDKHYERKVKEWISRRSEPTFCRERKHEL